MITLACRAVVMAVVAEGEDIAFALKMANLHVTRQVILTAPSLSAI